MVDMTLRYVIPRNFLTGTGSSIRRCWKTKWILIVITVLLMVAHLANTGYCPSAMCSQCMLLGSFRANFLPNVLF